MPRRLRILVTRPADQAVALTDRLRAIGVEPVAVPTVAILPPASFDAVDRALRNLDRYDWVLFTSPNGVRAFFGRYAVLGLVSTLPPSIRWAAIGPGTADAMTARGISPVWMPSRYLGEVVADELPAHPGQWILRVRADIASSLPAQRLRARGMVVDEVVAYQTQEAPEGSREVFAHAWAAGIDGVVFTSASTVRGFARLAAGLLQGPWDLLVIAIGPVTAKAVEAAGWPVHLVASEHSIDGIVRLLKERSDSGAAGHRAG